MKRKHEVRAYMHEVAPWKVEVLREFIRRLPGWEERHDSTLRLRPPLESTAGSDPTSRHTPSSGCY